MAIAHSTAFTTLRREGEELKLQAIPLVLVGPIDGNRGRSDAGQHGQGQKCSENYLHDGIQHANNTTLSRLAADHAVIA
jgi:hypothetical protein